MLRIFRRFDSRIASALREQRKTILQGLICVGLSAILTAGMIPLTERAINAVSEAAGIKIDLRRAVPYESELASSLGVKVEQIREAYARHPVDPALTLPAAEDLAADLHLDEAKVQEAIDSIKSGAAATPKSSAEQEDAIQRLGYICLAVVGLFGLKYWFTRGQSYYLSKAANRLASDLRIRLYDKLQRMPISYFTNRRAGAIQSVLTNDVTVYQTAVNLIKDSIDGPFKAVAALAAILFIQWKLAVIAILFIPVLAWFVQRNGKRMKQDQTKVQEDLAMLSAVTQESLLGVRVVKAFAAENEMARIYDGLVEQSFRSQMRAAFRFAQLRPMVELVGAVSLALILYICGHMAKAGELQVSQIVALTLALDVINQGARALSNVNNTYNQVQAAAARIYGEVLDAEEEHFDNRGTEIIDSPRGEIRFENVSFSYPDGTVALNDVSFTIPPGTSLALVGPSGAGKSTIADLMLRFYDPTSGTITLDGRDIRSLDLNWYRSKFGVVPQATFLFAGTIADNLRMGRKEITDEAVEESAKAANAMEFIQRMNDGLKEVLGERGAKLSGGEGQRLAIARALARQPLVLLLDEATSNLDTHSETLVQAALDKIMQERTTMFIAHRLSTAARAAKILVLSRGEVKEYGSHADLVAAGGLYANMFRLYTSGMTEDAIGA